MNHAYAEATKESYIPQECEAYGFNEVGGMKLDENGEWAYHCGLYRDTLDKSAIDVL